MSESPTTASRGLDWAPMSRRLDLPLALAAWLVGFAWVARTGSWLVLAVLQVLAAARLMAGDPATRRLFARNGLAITIGVAGALASIAATYALYGPVSALFPSFEGAVHHLYVILNADGYQRAGLVAMILVVISAEEIVWRGRLLQAGANGARRAPGWLVAQALLYGAVYGFAHATSGSVLLVMIAFALGTGWALLRILTGSLWAPVIAHALWDLAVLVLWPVF